MDGTVVSLEPVTTSTKWVAEVAASGGHHGSVGVFSYVVPDHLVGAPVQGDLVWVPLRKQTVLGIVVELDEREEARPLRPLIAVADASLRLTARQLEIAGWIARETVSSLFAAASPFFPPGISHRIVERIGLGSTPNAWPATLPTTQRRLLELLAAKGDMPLETARRELGTSLATVIPKLEAAGLLVRSVSFTDSTPRVRTERHLRLVDGRSEEQPRHAKQRAVIDYMRQRSRLASSSDGFVALSDILGRSGSDTPAVSALVKKGLLDEVFRPKQSNRDAGGLVSAPRLSGEQAIAWAAIERSLLAGESAPMLIHGVTGSGKTELYLRAAAWCLRRGKSAIVLVPEIALASQVVRRFEARFPGEVAIVHSAQREADRFAEWHRIAAGERRIIVGPRSALFAPAIDLGLIVVDEEHESAYKQDAEPRYHARDLAERIAAQTGATLLLGSATPSVETFWNSANGSRRKLTLTSRVLANQPQSPDSEESSLGLPDVTIVDMRHELRSGRPGLISEPLATLIERSLSAREQAMLLLNRRGTSTVVMCRTCGTAVQCPFCDIPLVFHQDRGRMLCHRCNFREMPRTQCGLCGGALDYFGAGTQRIEAEVQALFPAASVLRWDQDSVRRQGGHERLLGRVERREVDIVVGTQMIAKGLDLPMVTAVGVIHADTMLHLPDFRSGERTFQLLTQVAGRAGRRAPGSNVLIQTYSPAHYAIAAAARHDYQAFYDEEIGFRRVHRYPPFSRLIRFSFKHQDEEMCRAQADEMARALARHAVESQATFDLLGPTPAFASKVRGKHQWQIVLRARPEEFEAVLEGLPVRPGWSVDVDPQGML